MVIPLAFLAVPGFSVSFDTQHIRECKDKLLPVQMQSSILALTCGKIKFVREECTALVTYLADFLE